MAMLGKSIRISRLFNSKSGRFLAIMIDHTMARGLMPGLIDIENTLDKILAGEPDAVTMHKGIAEKCFERHVGKRTSLILKAASPSPYNPNAVAEVADVEEAIAFGADAIATGGIFCGSDQRPQMEHIARLSKSCRQFGMPLIGHIYPYGDALPKESREQWEHVAYAARAGAELGVDILKVHHNGDPETFSRIVEAVPTHVVLAGGNQGREIRNYLQMAKNAIDSGAAGVAFGRFVWQHENIPELIQALKQIVHHNASVDEAMEFLHDLEAKKASKREKSYA